MEDVTGTHNNSWWLRLTAPPGTDHYAEAHDKRERDRLRKAGLISGIAPFVFLAPLLLAGQASDPGTIVAIAGCMIASVVSLIFNRNSKQTIAALLLIFGMDAVIENALLHAPGGLGNAWLLTFDLFLLPLFLPGMLLSKQAIWVFMTLHVLTIIADYFLLPHTTDLTLLIQHWGITIGIARPLILEIGIGLLCFFQIKSTDQAIARADKAEQVAELQQEISMQKQELEDDIQKLSESLSQAANGRFNVRVDLEKGKTLWPVASKINTLLTRLQSSRQSDATLRQLEIDLVRLTEAVRATRMGQNAIWPLPDGSPADDLITELRNMAGNAAIKTQHQNTTPVSPTWSDVSRRSGTQY